MYKTYYILGFMRGYNVPPMLIETVTFEFSEEALQELVERVNSFINEIYYVMLFENLPDKYVIVNENGTYLFSQ